MCKRFLSRNLVVSRSQERNAMNALILNMAGQRSKELRDTASRRRLAGRRNRRTRSARPAAGGLDQLSIRRLDSNSSDREALDRLAGLDSADRPRGEVLGAELDGRLIAAISVSTGAVVADPFTRTDEARAQLELRASQLRRAGDAHGHTGRLQRLRLAARPRRG
jgi:hypothetical protein